LKGALSGAEPGATPVPDRAIHNRLNLALVVAVQAAAWTLLWIGARASGAWLLVAGVLYSFLLLTNYALIHEATHGNLNANPGWNRWLGVWAGFLFPIPFSMIKVTHTVHHCCNRTDHEMFDLYYASDNMVLKLGQWYGLMSGLFWPCIPVGTVILAVFPRLLRTAPFRKARTTAVLFDDFRDHGLRRVRVEVALMLLYWSVLFLGLGLGWRHLLAMYACFAFNWSTRQYVTHAFTPRDVVNGALNLSVSRPMSWVLLKGNWDLVHHQSPWLPWTALAKAGQGSVRPVSFWRQYLRMWAGPEPTAEPSPQRLAATPDPGA
jgi:fatty acid desaturase